MNEQWMQYIWAHRLYDMAGLETTSGERVRVLSPGIQNTDAGPDFFNACVRIGAREWAGNVEVHRNSSDWIRHGHHLDKAYDSVVLHVVGRCDMDIYRSNGEPVPQLVLNIPERFGDDCRYLLERDSFLPCAGRLHEIDSLLLSAWIGALAVERLQQKIERLFGWFDLYRGSWEEVCYISLARSLGFGVNSDPFERLARSLPLLFLQKHADSLLQTEAFLFGQASLLKDAGRTADAYYGRLCKEYGFLRHKFGLTPLPEESWKFFRLRPANFPHQRIAMLAQLVHEGFTLFSAILETESLEGLRQLFGIRLNGYWDNHYTFEQSSLSRSKLLGYGAIDVLLINAVVPLLYAYGMKTGSEAYGERALGLLEEMKPERNSIVNRFGEAGLVALSALESQAFLQLHREYCEKKKCFYCRIGHKLLSCSVRSRMR